MTYEKDLIKLRAKVLMQAILNEKPMTLELQNDFDFLMNYADDITRETIKSAVRLMKDIDNLPYINERDKI